MKDCLFCKIINKELSASIIAENEQIIVIKDIYPKAPIHYLIIPKKHITDITGFSDSDRALAGNLLLMGKQLAQSLSEPKAFRLVVNNGADAGQVIFHSHLHFLAGLKSNHNLAL